jgi:hypothetical protein
VEKGGRKKYITEMEEAPENGKESSHSVHGIGMDGCFVFASGMHHSLCG